MLDLMVLRRMTGLVTAASALPTHHGGRSRQHPMNVRMRVSACSVRVRLKRRQLDAPGGLEID